MARVLVNTIYSGYAGAADDGALSTGAQTIAGTKTFDNGVATDTITEKTAAAGVTINGVLLKDNKIGAGVTPDFAIDVVGQPGIRVNNNSASASGREFIRFIDQAGDVNGRIEGIATANTCQYLSGSDGRLKHKFEDFEALAMVSQMTPLKYERFSEPGMKEFGFVAQELYTVLPQAVSVGGEDVKTDPWMVDYAKVTAVLTKAIQELAVENETLKTYKSQSESRLVALEAIIAELQKS